MNKKKIIWEEKFPEISCEWDLSKNKIKIEKSTTSDKAWWICKKLGHSWEAKINNRIRGKGCPYCNSNKPCKENNLASNKDLMEKWDYDKNEIKPEDVLPKSTKKYWWKCDKNHSFLSSPHNMANRKTKAGCPYCSGHLPSKENNILGDALLKKEWDYDKNSGLEIGNMTKGKGVKVWWKCQYGHEWESSIASRVRGSGCPCCKRSHSRIEIRIYTEIKNIYNHTINGHKIKGKEIDIFIPDHRIGIEFDGCRWHLGKENKDIKKTIFLENNGIRIIRIRQHPLKKLFKNDIELQKNIKDIDLIKKIFDTVFRINKDKNLRTAIKKMTKLDDKSFNNNIANIKMPQKNFNDIRPALIKEWNYKKNSGIDPFQISYGSGLRAWWVCDKNHEWQAPVKQRVLGSGCPYCHGRCASKENNLLLNCRNIKKYWDFEKNSLGPENFTPKSNKKAYFLRDNKSIFIRINDFVNWMARNQEEKLP